MAKRRAGPRFQGPRFQGAGCAVLLALKLLAAPFWASFPAPVWVSPKPRGSAGPPMPSAGRALTSFLPVSPLLPVPSGPQPLELRGSAPPPDAGTRTLRALWTPHWPHVPRVHIPCQPGSLFLVQKVWSLAYSTLR